MVDNKGGPRLHTDKELIEDRINKEVESKVNERVKEVESKVNDRVNERVKEVESKVNERVNERVKEVESKVNDKVNERVKEVEEKYKPADPEKIGQVVRDAVKSVLPEIQQQTAQSKVHNTLENIKKRQESGQGSEQPGQGSKSGVDSHEHDGLSCPTCHSGHVHALQVGKDGTTDGMSYKCTGPGCGKEFVMVDKTADYKCKGCGSPIKKPEENSKVKVDACPFCKGHDAVKFNWEKLWKVQK